MIGNSKVIFSGNVKRGVGGVFGSMYDSFLLLSIQWYATLLRVREKNSGNNGIYYDELLDYWKSSNKFLPPSLMQVNFHCVI